MSRLSSLGFQLMRPILHHMDAEKAHHLTIEALKLGSLLCKPPQANPTLHMRVAGLDFPNPLGLAAGFDKNAEVPDALLGLGFGFVEVGTVTPLPQMGNAKPRLFRLVEDQAVINRMGFNNDGHQAVLQRLRQRKAAGLVGINIGANKETADRVADYVAGIAAFAGQASYFTVNISSPNTPGLRNLQSEQELRPLLARLNEARQQLAKPVPMFLKIAPDLTDGELEAIATCCSHGAVDGVIISNTTLHRPPLKSAHAAQSGGLSGRPLFDLATWQLARFYQLTGGRIPVIGVGGIASAEQAWIKICAGASLIQLYSALVYHGPQLVADILTGLATRLQQQGFKNLQAVVGSQAAQLAQKKPAGR